MRFTSDIARALIAQHQTPRSVTWFCGPAATGKSHLVRTTLVDTPCIDLDETPLDEIAAIPSAHAVVVDHVQPKHFAALSALPARAGATLLVGRAPHAPMAPTTLRLPAFEVWHDEGRTQAQAALAMLIGPDNIGDEARAALSDWSAAYGDTALGRARLAEQFQTLGLAAASSLGELAAFESHRPHTKARHGSVEAAAAHISAELDEDAQRLLSTLAALGPICEGDAPLVFTALDVSGAAMRALVEAGAVYLNTDRPRTLVALRLFTPGKVSSALKRQLHERQRARIVDMSEAWRRNGEEQDASWLRRHVPLHFARATTSEERVELLVASEPALMTDPARITKPPLSDIAGGLAPRHPQFALATRITARAYRVLGHAAEAAGFLERALATEPHAPLLLMEQAVLAHEARSLFDAEALYQRANDMVPLADRALRARAAQNLGALYHDMGELDLAEQQYVAALDELAVSPNPRLSGIIAGNLGVLDQERGRHDDAQRAFTRAIDELRRASAPRFLGITLGNAAALALLEGHAPQALALQTEALELLREVGDKRSCALGEVRCALALVATGETAKAGASFARARELLRALGDKISLRGMELAEDFAALIAPQTPFDPEQLQRARDIARTGQPCLLEQNDEARFVLRLFERRASHDADQTATTRVHADGHAFVCRGETTDISRRPALCRVLAYLAAEQGTPRSIDAIFDAGWGESADLASARNRVYVALSTLRKLGLKDAIVRSEDGYALAPDVAVATTLAPN